jgi:DnaJ-class molecular chaperone
MDIEKIKVFYNLMMMMNKHNQDIKIEINITLEELYNNIIKKCVVNVMRNYKLEDITLYISLTNYETTYVFKNMGDNFLYDIIVTLNIIEHPCIKIDTVLSKYDLYIDKTITLYHYYYGLAYTIDFLNNEKLNIKYNKYDNLTKVIKNKGLPFLDKETNKMERGDLYIFFRISYPKHDNYTLNKIKRFMLEYFD